MSLDRSYETHEHPVPPARAQRVVPPAGPEGGPGLADAGAEEGGEGPARGLLRALVRAAAAADCGKVSTCLNMLPLDTEHTISPCVVLLYAV